MSGSHTPESVLSISSSSSSSGRRLDSNTTPSPSGGNRSPKFNPRALSNKLAMLEASQALAQAASTLSIAAQAMSKAAASLAAVGDFGDEDYTYEAGYSGDAEDWVQSPDWTQSSYNLSFVPDTSSAREIDATDEGYELGHVGRSVLVDGASEIRQERPSQSQPSTIAHVPVAAPLNSTPQVVIAQTLPPVSSNQWTPSMPTDTTSSAEEPIPPVVPVGSKTSLASGNTIAIRSEPGAKASKTASTIPAPISAPVSTTSSIPAKGCSSSPDPNAPSYQSSGPGVQHKASPAASAKSKGLPSPNSTRIILERGFDLFPALCQITKRCAKTVCLYNYSGLTATISIAVMLRANIKVPVMIPSSTKQEKLVAAAKQFNSAQSGVLLWPGCITLPEITGLADLSNVQLIQLGLPIKTSIATASSIATVILARSDLTQPQAAQNKDLPIDSLSESCNQQGPKSPLEPFRIWLRSRLSDDSFARGFYWDWFMQYRRQNPKQSIIDALKLANQYAEQFLLRGESKKYGEPVGGKVTVTEGTVRNQKLEAAVKAGVLLVA